MPEGKNKNSEVYPNEKNAKEWLLHNWKAKNVVNSWGVANDAVRKSLADARAEIAKTFNDENELKEFYRFCSSCKISDSTSWQEQRVKKHASVA